MADRAPLFRCPDALRRALDGRDSTFTPATAADELVPEVAVGTFPTAQGPRTVWSRARVEPFGSLQLSAGEWVVGAAEFARRLAEGTARYAPGRRSVGTLDCAVVDLDGCPSNAGHQR